MFKLSDNIANEAMNNCIFNLWNKNIFFLHYNVCTSSKNYPYLPHGRDFSLDPPPPHHPSGNSSQASYIYLNFGPLRTPTPRNFLSLLWGEYGYFLEPHNVKKIITLKNASYTLQAVAKRKPENIQTWIPTWMSLANYIVTGSWSSIG